MEEKLKQMLGALESGALSASDKTFIRKEYLKSQGIKLDVNTNCPNCWSDAIIIILNSLKENKIITSPGFVAEYNGKIYNRHNMTDVIATKIMAENPKMEMYFSIKK